MATTGCEGLARYRKCKTAECSGYSPHHFESLFLDLHWHTLVRHNPVQQGCNALLRGGTLLVLILSVGDAAAEWPLHTNCSVIL